MVNDLMATIGAVVFFEGAMVNARVWVDRSEAPPQYVGQCTRGDEIICTVGPFETPEWALLQAIQEALAPDKRREGPA